jgi:hypothetical protein
VARECRFDHRVVVGREAQPMSGLDEMVAEIAVARQPEPTVDDRQVAAQPIQANGLAGVHLECPAMEPLVLRIHHQSPALRIAMIGALACEIQ